MKTLVIATMLPLPENSGDRIRTMNFARYFSKSGSVDILYYHDEKGVEAEYSFGSVFHVEKDQGTYGSRLFQLYEKLKYSKPWHICRFTRECVEKVERIIDYQDYDVIFCRYADNAYPLFFLPEALKKRVIVDIDDLISGNLYKTIHGAMSRIIKIKRRIDFRFNQSYQKRCAALGTSLVCSESDRKKLEGHISSENLFIVPNVSPPVELPNTYVRDGHRNLGTILFVGNLSYQPNVQGLNWFITEIFTRLAAVDGAVMLIVAGRNPDPSLRSLCSQFKRIQLVESPADVIPLYEKCGIVIVPLLAGGGTRIKILEAGNALRPVISTEIGAYGLGLVEYNNLLYMKDYQTFIDRYQWLGNRENYQKLVANMHKHVTENYSVETFDRSMDLVMSRIGEQ